MKFKKIECQRTINGQMSFCGVRHHFFVEIYSEIKAFAYSFISKLNIMFLQKIIFLEKRG